MLLRASTRDYARVILTPPRAELLTAAGARARGCALRVPSPRPSVI